MKKLLRELIVGPKDAAEGVQLMAWLGFLTFLGLAIWAVVGKGQAFDPQGYGIGIGAVLASAGAGLGMKSRFERHDGDGH